MSVITEIRQKNFVEPSRPGVQGHSKALEVTQSDLKLPTISY